MEWVFFQVFLAFGVGILIVWWTWPKSSQSPKSNANNKQIPAKTLDDTTSVDDTKN